MTILCATDFSPCSMAATELAAAVARRFGDPLLLLHVVEPLALAAEAPPGASIWTHGMLQAAERSTQQAAAAIAGKDLQVTPRVLLGPADSLIVETAREHKVRFIVLGTHGRRGAAHLFAGSVAEQVARQAPCPVIVTRDRPAGIGSFAHGSLRLAAALDGTTSSLTALTWLRDLCGITECDVAAIRTYWPPDEAFRYGVENAWIGSEGAPELVRLLSRDLAAQLRSVCTDRPCQVRLRPATHDPADALAAEAALLQPDAIVLGVPAGRHRGGALSLAAVLRVMPVPVICIPPGLSASARPIPELRSMLVATDLSDGSRDLVRTAYAHLRAGGGRVELVHAHVIEPPAMTPLEAERRSTLEARLQALVPPDAPALGIQTRISVIEGRTAAEAILQAADRLSVDLVAVGSHGRRGLRRAVLGSVAEAVTRHSLRPVVVLPTA